MSFLPPPQTGAVTHLFLIPQDDVPGDNVIEPIVTQVIDVDGDSLTVAAPAVHLSDWPEIGSVFDVHWFSNRGRHEVHAQLDVYSTSGQKWWGLASIGEARTVQERRYVRGGGGEPARVRRSDDEVFSATVIDLSESSVRVRVAAGLLAGEQVQVDLLLDGLELRVPGSVLRARGAQERHYSDVVILLEPTPGECDTIRGYIFAAQLKARSAASRS